MKITKNDIEVNLDDKTTLITLDEDEIIKISEDVKYFDSKLSYGSLILEYDNKEINIENITNVLNTSNAKIEFTDYTIDSMDQLFELVKHSLSSEFRIDIKEVMYEDEEEDIKLIYDIIDEKTNINSLNNELDNKSLLIIISTTEINSILNFPLIYSNLSSQKKEWREINIIFSGNSINCLDDNRLISYIKECISNEITIYYFNTTNIDLKEEYESIGILKTENSQIITKALKSEKWRVLSI